MGGNKKTLDGNISLVTIIETKIKKITSQKEGFLLTQRHRKSYIENKLDQRREDPEEETIPVLVERLRELSTSEAEETQQTINLNLTQHPLASSSSSSTCSVFLTLFFFFLLLFFFLSLSLDVFDCQFSITLTESKPISPKTS